MNDKSLNMDEGFTLAEVLIASAIFAFLAVLLTGLLQSGLGIWKSGESRGDISERGQIIMGKIKTDFTNIFTEPDKRTILANEFNQSLPLEKSYLSEPSFYSSLDKNGNQWLYFIRLDDDNLYSFISPTYQKVKQRIIYRLDTTTSTPQLARGTVEETVAVSFWEQQLDQLGEIPTAQSVQTFDDVLYLTCSFSDSQGIATRWDSRKPPPPAPQTGAFPIIPQNLPGAVKVTLDIKPLPLNTPKITLVENVISTVAQIKINITQSLLETGKYIKIDNEWLLVQKKYPYRLDVARGVRDSIYTEHNAGAEVQYGETIENIFYIPTAK